MSPELMAIHAVGVSILVFLGRLSVRLTVVEKVTGRLSVLLEGLGLAGRLPQGGATAFVESQSFREGV